MTSERLQRIPLHDLTVWRALARTGFAHSQTEFQRQAARKDIADIEAEYRRRGYQVPA